MRSALSLATRALAQTTRTSFRSAARVSIRENSSMPSDLYGAYGALRASKDRATCGSSRKPARRHVRASWAAVAIASLLVGSAGCVMVGPDYQRPDAPVADDWRD